MDDEDVDTLLEGVSWEELQEGIVGWARNEEFTFPWRVALSEWQALVTEVLLQRTRAEAVAAIYEDFFVRFWSPEELARATEDEVRAAIRSLGLLWRAKHLPELGAALMQRGAVPSDRSDIESLPGIGPYAAGAFLTFSRNQHVPFVDANVVRLLSRLFGFERDGETRRKKWLLKLVARLFDHDYSAREFGYALLDFTREVCGMPPKCEICPLVSHCDYGGGSLVDDGV